MPNTKTLLEGSRLQRKEDGKVFACTWLSHWSDIQSDDGEIVSIKWLGDDSFVGEKGGTYTIIS